MKREAAAKIAVVLAVRVLAALSVLFSGNIRTLRRLSPRLRTPVPAT